MTNVEQIAALEWANYAATVPLAEVTPGLEVALREDVIITSSELFPTADANHACLLRASPEKASALLDEVTAHFQALERPVTVYLSPACQPADLEARLLARGFVRQAEEESWMLFDLEETPIPPLFKGVEVRHVDEENLPTFARLFLKAFELPEEYAPYMIQLLEPSLPLPTVTHYMALAKETPIGTMTLMQHEDVGILGSAGVLQHRRGRGAVTNLAITLGTEAREQGARYVILQTTAGTMLERLLRIGGFRRLFTRTAFIL